MTATKSMPLGSLRKTYEAIQAFHTRQGKWPLASDLSGQKGLSVASVHTHTSLLRKLGLIVSPNRAPYVIATDKPLPWLEPVKPSTSNNEPAPPPARGGTDVWDINTQKFTPKPTPGGELQELATDLKAAADFIERVFESFTLLSPNVQVMILERLKAQVASESTTVSTPREAGLRLISDRKIGSAQKDAPKTPKKQPEPTPPKAVKEPAATPPVVAAKKPSKDEAGTTEMLSGPYYAVTSEVDGKVSTLRWRAGHGAAARRTFDAAQGKASLAHIAYGKRDVLATKDGNVRGKDEEE